MRDKNRIFIKNMVCPRCIKVVEDELESLGYQDLEIRLGEATFSGKLDLPQIKSALEKNGFEILETKEKQLIDKIKTEIILLVQDFESLGNQNLSNRLSENIGLEYAYLSQIFSSSVGLTIEKYHILQRIEKVKELLVYDELSLKEIAYKLGYSSLAHFSAQFKKVTGLTPGYFREIGQSKRKFIDSIS